MSVIVGGGCVVDVDGRVRDSEVVPRHVHQLVVLFRVVDAVGVAAGCHPLVLNPGCNVGVVVTNAVHGPREVDLGVNPLVSCDEGGSACAS